MPVTGSINGYTASTILDGSGNGRVQLGPTRVREFWTPISAAVKCSTNVKESICDMYLGSTPNATTFFAHSIQASTGDTAGVPGIQLQPGMFIWIIWAGGDAGATATLTLTGTYRIGR